MLEAFSRLCLLPNIEELHLPEITLEVAEVEQLLSKIPQNSKLAYIALNTGDISSDLRACSNRYFVMGRNIHPVKVGSKKKQCARWKL